jgi:hypothetical protein
MTSGPAPTGATVGRIDLCSRFQFNIKTACLAKRRESIDLTLGVMYKTALILSTIPSFNVFRAALSGAIGSGYLDHFLICSGFFHERVNTRGSFYASDAFASAKLPPGSSVTVVGAYDPAATEFDDFVSKLQSGLPLASGTAVTVSKRRSLRRYANHWHAKIFIAREGNFHRLAVVGSSNLTRSAFDARASNNEADVLIWDDSHAPTRQLVNSALARPPDLLNDAASTPAVIVSTYDPNDSRNTDSGTMDSRLKALWDDVLAATA